MKQTKIWIIYKINYVWNTKNDFFILSTSFSFYLCVCLSLYFALSLSLCVFLCVCVSLSVSHFASLCIDQSINQSINLCIYLSPSSFLISLPLCCLLSPPLLATLFPFSLSLSLSLSLSISLSLSLSFPPSLSLCPSLSLSLSLSLPLSLFLSPDYATVNLASLIPIYLIFSPSAVRHFVWIACPQGSSLAGIWFRALRQIGHMSISPSGLLVRKLIHSRNEENVFM